MLIKADSKNGLIIATIDSAIKVLTIQPEGKQKMDAKQFMNSNKLKVGDIIKVYIDKIEKEKGRVNLSLIEE